MNICFFISRENRSRLCERFRKFVNTASTIHNGSVNPVFLREHNFVTIIFFSSLFRCVHCRRHSLKYLLQWRFCRFPSDHNGKLYRQHPQWPLFSQPIYGDAVSPFCHGQPPLGFIVKDLRRIMREFPLCFPRGVSCLPLLRCR